MNDVDHILLQIESGDPAAAEQLWPLVYHELRRIAVAKLAGENPGQTLQPTALVHEVWLRLCRQPETHWRGRGHFFAAAAEAMRRILVDRARQKKGPRRGGGRQRVELAESVIAVIDKDDELLAINDALELLAAESPIKAELVKLRFFVGLDHQEAAALLGISRATADRYWAYAKAFLYDALQTT